MKKFFLFSAALCFAVATFAIPAKRVKRTITLSDGTQKEVVVRGDENGHYYEATDGTCYQKSGNTYRLVDKTAVQARLRARFNQRNAVRKARLAKRMAAPRKADATPSPYTGQKKGLVILVNFADTKVQPTHGQAFYNRFFNEKGFSDDGMQGSVHDYFLASSYNQFDLTFDVVGPVTVSKKMEYYGANTGAGESDAHAAEMVIEACKLANAQGVDFTKYDWDKDGYVDQVFCIYAGYGEAQGQIENTIWPHEYWLSAAKENSDGTGALQVDGVTVDTYAVSSELAGGEGTTVDGIGTACHEFSHCLGFPDFYDTGDEGNFGMDSWDLMDYGAYNGEEGRGECPFSYSSYERMTCGWLKPTELTEGTKIEGMKALTDAPEAYIIYNQGHKDEYYLLENRQQKGFDTYASGHGLLVLHVDYVQKDWDENTVNNASSHQGLTIVPADGTFKTGVGLDGGKYASEDDLAGDPYPGISGNKALTDASKPAATLYHANKDGRTFLGKPIEEITESSEGLISFLFDGGVKLPTPEAQAASAITAAHDGFTASWNAIEGAEEYEVRLISRDGSTPSPEESVLLTEGFAKFKAGTKDGSNDKGASLDEFMTTKGWKGEKLYQTPAEEMKMGTGKVVGTLTSPEFTATEGVVTVAFEARQYGTTKSQLTVLVNDVAVKTFDLGASVKYVCSAPAEGPCTVSLVTTTDGKRCYLSEVTLYDGEFSAEDLANEEAGVVRQARAKKVATYKTKDTHYTFTGLNPAFTYAYQVRALSKKANSLWSNTVAVDFTTGLTQLETPAAVDGKAALYDLSGRRLTTRPTHGIYLQNGKKYIVK